ncbi:serine/threonine-protein kinase [Sphaerimonospora mesophila]|uniref:serine/threonine-protein kinase n=1 Tax=Sphaerimonospora mesophila TaxID=37483 RepID=UPI0006E3189F
MSQVSPLQPEDPRRLGDYVLSGRLGAGGQGIVFLAGRPGGASVAVKLLHARLADGESARRRFAREVEAVRRVAPFCTARVLDADLEGDHPYIVSEYVDGVSLRDDVIARGPRSGGALERIAVGTATALAAIHRAGVVHRDFKPGNVLLAADGPRVIDFGISRLADATATTGGPVGTPAYLAPEQLRGEPTGPAADMFSWALTVSYAASGRHAFAADTYAAVLGRILYGTPDLGRLSGPLREIAVACLAADPADRPTAEDVLSSLLGTPTTATPKTATTTAPAMTPASAAEPVLAERTDAHGRRRTIAVAATVLGAAALTTTGLIVALGGGESSYQGMWSGMARHPTAGRTFPVELYLSEPARMRWGADLHCEGRLTVLDETGAEAVLRLDQVSGEACHPGTVTIRRRGERQATLEVRREGEESFRYSGVISRTS